MDRSDSVLVMYDDGSENTLPGAELSLLEVFAARPNRGPSRDQILKLAQYRNWGPFDCSVDIRVARVHCRFKRPPNLHLIRTMRGADCIYVPAESGTGRQPT